MNFRVLFSNAYIIDYADIITLETIPHELRKGKKEKAVEGRIATECGCEAYPEHAADELCRTKIDLLQPQIRVKWPPGAQR